MIQRVSVRRFARVLARAFEFGIDRRAASLYDRSPTLSNATEGGYDESPIGLAGDHCDDSAR